MTAVNMLNSSVAWAAMALSLIGLSIKSVALATEAHSFDLLLLASRCAQGSHATEMTSVAFGHCSACGVAVAAGLLAVGAGWRATQGRRPQGASSAALSRADVAMG